MTEKTKSKVIIGLLLSLFFVLGAACRLTSPMPASWAGTPAAQTEAAASTVHALTQQTGTDEALNPTPTQAQPTLTATPTSQPTQESDGPWLVYPAPDRNGLHAYDIDSGEILEIPLPEPVYTADLVNGLSPDGHNLIVRAGSAENIDELALYRIDLPSTQAVRITPLLSLALQREIVNQGDERALETLEVLTRSDCLAWSSDGAFLAFTAALDGNSSDLYVLDTEKERITRLNGLYSQSAAPFWAPENNWLISQELDRDAESGWRSEVVSAISMPGYVEHNALYLPPSGSRNEVFLGWINAQSFLSYSQTANGAVMLRQVNVETPSVGVILQTLFKVAAYGPASKSLAYILPTDGGSTGDLMEGVYLLGEGRVSGDLLRAGTWQTLRWDAGGMFVAAGVQGVFAFTPEGESMLLSEESDLQVSPNGNWIVAWGDGEDTAAGARLYQSSSGNLLQQLTDTPAAGAYWGLDSKSIFIQLEGVLYHLAFPGLNPIEVEGGFTVDEKLIFTWLE